MKFKKYLHILGFVTYGCGYKIYCFLRGGGGFNLFNNRNFDGGIMSEKG